MITHLKTILARYRIAPRSGASAHLQSMINAIFPPIEEVVAETSFHAWMQITPTEFVQRTILLDGAFEPLTIALAMKLLSPGDQFVDAGAHVGLFTLAAATAGANVLSIEADPNTFSRLCKNISLNQFKNVTPLCTALWAGPGILRMTRPEKLNTGMNRVALTPESSDGFLSPSISLNMVINGLNIRDIKLLKMDIEGAELPVLRSFFNQPTVKPSNVIFEYWPEYFPDSTEVVSLLRENGYQIRDILGREFSPMTAPPEHNLWASLHS